MGIKQTNTPRRATVRVADDSAAAKARSEAESKGLRVYTIRSAGSKAELFSSIARALSFPDYFGKNWDALDECLSDLSWAPANGYLIVLEEADELLKLPEADFASFVGVLESAGEIWQKDNKPFDVLLLGSDALARRVHAVLAASDQR